MPVSEQNEFFRIREKSSGQYFGGGRGTIYFSPKGMRYETLQPVTAALNYFEGEYERAVELVKKYTDSGDPQFADRITYWQSIADKLKSENFEVIKYREVIEAVETIK